MINTSGLFGAAGFGSSTRISRRYIKSKPKLFFVGNKQRFPSDFLFQLSHDEREILRRHFGTSRS